MSFAEAFSSRGGPSAPALMRDTSAFRTGLGMLAGAAGGGQQAGAQVRSRNAVFVPGAALQGRFTKRPFTCQYLPCMRRMPWRSSASVSSDPSNRSSGYGLACRSMSE